MNVKIVAGVLGTLVLAASTAGFAEDPPAKASVPVRLLIVFTRYQGDKKVASFPCAIQMNANERRPGKLRMGTQVPLRYEGKDNPGNVVYKNVGNNLDCHVDSVDAERFRVSCSLEQSSAYTEGAAGPSASGQRQAGQYADATPPLLRTFSSEAAVILKDGQTTQHSMATDPVSGEMLKVDVTLTVLK
jgi:hypothetical protein